MKQLIPKELSNLEIIEKLVLFNYLLLFLEKEFEMTEEYDLLNVKFFVNIDFKENHCPN